MNPLVIMLCYNRWPQTAIALESFEAATNFNDIDLVVVDNGSNDDTAQHLRQWQAGRRVEVLYLPENIGCPRALNRVMHDYRRPGQDIIKLDNDVRTLAAGWLYGVRRFFAHCAERGRRVAMVSGHYPEIFTNKRIIGQEFWEWKRIIHYFPSIGAAIWYNARFIELAGYFDVLTANHLYGFEDLIMSAKAAVIEWEVCAWEGWAVEHMHCANSLGSGRTAEVARLRPLYEQRVRTIQLGGAVFTGPDGIPQLSQTKGEKL